MFQTNEGPSFPAHQFIISGTSAPTATSTLFVSENPAKTTEAAGCIAPADQTVKVIDPAGSETSNPAIYPCFEHPTLTDLLDAANVSWRYYAPSAGSIWTAPDAIEHMCVPSAPTGGESVRDRIGPARRPKLSSAKRRATLRSSPTFKTISFSK